MVDYGYYVVRLWCHTDKNLLWQVLSRPMGHLVDAKVLVGFENRTNPDKEPAFIVKVIEESELKDSDFGTSKTRLFAAMMERCWNDKKYLWRVRTRNVRNVTTAIVTADMDRDDQKRRSKQRRKHCFVVEVFLNDEAVDAALKAKA